MCAVCSDRSLNLVVGQIFVGDCSVGFFSDHYYHAKYQCSRLHYFCPSLVEFLGGIEGFKCIKFYLARRNVNFGDVLVILVLFRAILSRQNTLCHGNITVTQNLLIFARQAQDLQCVGECT